MVNAFEVNEERIEKLKFDANGLIPAVAQDVKSGDVVMLAYMNKESLTETIKTGYATYFSRSRQQLWKKGRNVGQCTARAGDTLDCDGDALSFGDRPDRRGVPYGRKYSCFHNSLTGKDESAPASSHVLGVRLPRPL